jgi:hypothetical protein
LVDVALLEIPYFKPFRRGGELLKQTPSTVPEQVPSECVLWDIIQIGLHHQRPLGSMQEALGLVHLGEQERRTNLMHRDGGPLLVGKAIDTRGHHAIENSRKAPDKG